MIIVYHSLLGHYSWEAICDDVLGQSFTSKENAKSEFNALIDAHFRIDEHLNKLK